MKLQTSVNELVLSNVQTTGEFRIRNSAKAFSILSSGLYSNKIKAIVRELSCNAVDSHAAAGKQDVQFEVHLPSQLEPWFSVKDFGLGLDYEGVTQIYTTYFESTKTDSNQFIGALGLGSKSPFSYTDNFTITAIKDGVQRIFSAFINESGIPSVAEMGQCETTDCNGVEVKFSVTETYDFSKFRDEAREVFCWFKLKPIITLPSYQTKENIYTEKDVIPGVHICDSRRNGPVAVMGNIAYPLASFPNKTQLGSLAPFLECNLELHFEIGELDFAASREELSYIPSTIESIKKKLTLLSDKLVTFVADKVDSIDNMWERAFELKKMSRETIFRPSVSAYITSKKFPLLEDSSYYSSYRTFKFDARAVLSDYGIKVNNYNARHNSVSNSKPSTTYNHRLGVSTEIVQVEVQPDFFLIFDDLKKGGVARTKAHFRNGGGSGRILYLTSDEPDIAKRLEQYEEFAKRIHTPPKILKTSEFEKTVSDKKSGEAPAFLEGHVTISTYSSSKNASINWSNSVHRPADKRKYKYVPMTTFSPLKKVGEVYEAFKLGDYLEIIANSYLPDLKSLNIYGVRKRKLKEVEELSNWQTLTDYYLEEINKITLAQIEAMTVNEIFDGNVTSLYTNTNIVSKINPGSKFLELMKLKTNSKKLETYVSKNTLDLCSKYHTTIKVDEVRTRVKAQLDEIKGLYPMLRMLGYVSSTDENYADIVNYINLVDSSLACSA